MISFILRSLLHRKKKELLPKKLLLAPKNFCMCTQCIVNFVSIQNKIRIINLKYKKNK